MLTGGAPNTNDGEQASATIPAIAEKCQPADKIAIPRPGCRVSGPRSQSGTTARIKRLAQAQGVLPQLKAEFS
jgi:hypothetical protein